MLSNGPQAIIAGELAELDANLFYVSRELVTVHLKRQADNAYQISLAGRIVGPLGLAWYTIKTLEVTTPEQAANRYNVSTTWAENISAAAVERYTLAAIEELLT